MRIIRKSRIDPDPLKGPKTYGLVPKESGFWSIGNVGMKRAMLRVLVDTPNTSQRSLVELFNISRATVIKWFNNEEFQKALTEKRDAAVNMKRHRREHETTIITDILASKAVKRLTDNKQTDIDFVTTRAMLQEYRAFRDEERKDTGEATSRSESKVTMEGKITVDENHSSRQNFLTFIQNNLSGAQIPQGVPTRDAVVDVGSRLLLSTPVMEQILEEDKQIEEVEKANADRKR